MERRQLRRQGLGQGVTGYIALQLHPQRGSDGGYVGGEIGSGLGDIDADAHDDPVRRTVGPEGGFRQDAADLFAAQQQVVGPFDAAVQAADLLNGAAHGHCRQRRDHGQRVGAQAGAPQDGQVQAQPRGRLEAAAHAAAARRLAVRCHHGIDDALRGQPPALGIGGVHRVVMVHGNVHSTPPYPWYSTTIRRRCKWRYPLMPDSSGDGGLVRCDKEKAGILAVSWQRNVLLFAGAARIIGETNREEGLP